MRVDLELLRPSVRAKGTGSPDLTPAERTYIDTLQALADSLRSDDEMAEAAEVLNPLLDARLAPGISDDLARRLDEIARSILRDARGARDARSGMAVEICLDALRLDLGDAKALLGEART